VTVRTKECGTNPSRMNDHGAVSKQVNYRAPAIQYSFITTVVKPLRRWHEYNNNRL